jgi:arylsulfatase A-like enzyme
MGAITRFLVHWPKGIKAKGEIRDQYAHAIDMVPTVLESLGIEAPTELHAVAQPRSKGSASPTPSTTPSAPTNHHTQYIEMFAHRSLYHDGWHAVCPFPGTSFAEAGVSFGMLELIETNCVSWMQPAGSSITLRSTRLRPRSRRAGARSSSR